MVALTNVDSRPRPAARVGESPRLTALWLFSVAALVFAMVVIGGATRLTGSGLSITEWKPVTGAIPPLTQADWIAEFDKYRASSQYRLINEGLTLAQFQFLFWWEWGHRLLGRAVGVVFGVPFVALLATRRLPRRLWGRCGVLFVLGGLQGLVGWWMVESGLEGRASVAPERLAAHLGLALILLSALVWTALDALRSPPAPAPRRVDKTASALSALLAGAVYLQCLMGALVAGNRAGLIDGDWPLMAGRLFPEGYWRGGVWATFVHGLQATQFDHRVLAYAIVVFLGLTVWRLSKGASWIRLRSHLAVVFGLLALQIGLGVATLWLSVPLPLALAHQANAALLLMTCVALAWRARYAGYHFTA